MYDFKTTTKEELPVEVVAKTAKQANYFQKILKGEETIGYRCFIHKRKSVESVLFYLIESYRPKAKQVLIEAYANTWENEDLGKPGVIHSRMLDKMMVIVGSIDTVDMIVLGDHERDVKRGKPAKLTLVNIRKKRIRHD